MKTLAFDNLPKKLQNEILLNDWVLYSRFSLHPNLFLVIQAKGSKYRVIVADLKHQANYYKSALFHSFSDAMQIFNSRQATFLENGTLFDESVEIVTKD